MNQIQNIAQRSIIFAIYAMVFAVVFANNAHAGCADGLPCVTPLTPNPDPYDGVIDQNEPGAPNAHKTTSTMCDADFMNQIYAKAWLEAEREMVIGNTIVKKPDSVLEYTCFDQLVADIANDAEPIFSDNFDFGTFDVNSDDPGGPSIADLVEFLTLEALKEYVDDQFPHDFLGGAASGDNNSISSTVNGVEGVCAFMFELYDVAKCDDFGLDAPFMTFEEYFSTPALISTDPRTLPEACPSNHGITQDIINVAVNRDWTYAPIDPVDLLLEHQAPAEGDCEISDPIPTGVMVTYVENDVDLFGNPIQVERYTYEEKFCPNPGCYFDNNDNAAPGDDSCEAQ